MDFIKAYFKRWWKFWASIILLGLISGWIFGITVGGSLPFLLNAWISLLEVILSFVLFAPKSSNENIQ